VHGVNVSRCDSGTGQGIVAVGLLVSRVVDKALQLLRPLRISAIKGSQVVIVEKISCAMLTEITKNNGVYM